MSELVALIGVALFVYGVYEPDVVNEEHHLGVLAAKRLGIRDVILPDDNKPDAAELSPWVLKGMKLHYVSNVTKVFELALRPGE